VSLSFSVSLFAMALSLTEESRDAQKQPHEEVGVLGDVEKQPLEGVCVLSDVQKQPHTEEGPKDRSRSPTHRSSKAQTQSRLPGLQLQSRLPVLQTHSSVDFSTWTLTMSARNKYGNMNWNLRAPEFCGNVFNFHELPIENRTGDPWSTIVWEVKAETFEGAPADKVKVTYEISEEQEVSINRFDDSLITMIEKQSCDVLNQKTPVKRELIASQHYKSALTQGSETRGPKVKMTFVVRNDDPKRLGVMHYFKLSEDGETYLRDPVVVKGWDQIQPLIEGHNLRGAKMRATVVSCWTINVMKKEVYPMMEIKEMYVREPKVRAVSYAGLNDEQQALIHSME